MPPGAGKALLQHVRIELVVGVEEGEAVAPGKQDALALGRSVALVGFAEDVNAAVPRGKTPDNGQGAVDAAVVDEDDLDVPQRLVHDAGKAVSDEGLGVPGSDDNGNGGRQEALRLPMTAFLSLMIRKRKVRDAGHGNAGTLFP